MCRACRVLLTSEEWGLQRYPGADPNRLRWTGLSSILPLLMGGLRAQKAQERPTSPGINQASNILSMESKDYPGIPLLVPH